MALSLAITRDATAALSLLPFLPSKGPNYFLGEALIQSSILLPLEKLNADWVIPLHTTVLMPSTSILHSIPTPTFIFTPTTRTSPPLSSIKYVHLFETMIHALFLCFAHNPHCGTHSIRCQIKESSHSKTLKI